MPRILVAGASSGVGKTSVALGLAAAYKNRGLKVQTFKTGPDFLDPTYLRLASGQLCYNLDTWMMGAQYVKQLFAQHAICSDLNVIEGAMGLFDGVEPTTSQGSCAEIGSLLQVPVLLVADAHGTARSLAALVKGYVEFEPSLCFAGIIANNCGSARHTQWLKEALDSCSLPPLLGAIPKGGLPRLPSRHLGLVTADSTILTKQIVDELASRMEQHLRLDRILECAKSAISLSGLPQPVEPIKRTPHVRLGIARDQAFHFYYPDNLEAIEHCGVELVWFSPLKDKRLPSDLDGLYLGGGYPEAHAAELAANHQMRTDIKRFAGTGSPLYAECGGLMYLAQGLECLDGQTHSMAGVLPFHTRMRKSRKALGYVEVCLNARSIFGDQGTTLRGHEFHYSSLVTDQKKELGWSKAYTLRRRRGNTTQQEGFVRGEQLASYVHTHFACQPQALVRFVSACGDANG